MRGLWIDAGRLVLRDDLPEPVLEPGETRVAVHLAGVWATDLALARGYLSFRGTPAPRNPTGWSPPRAPRRCWISSSRRSSGGGGRLFRPLAREDLRHLLKHKRTCAPLALRPRERALLANPSGGARFIRARWKPIYTWLTRRLLGWQDREGRGERPPAAARPAPGSPGGLP